MILCVGGYVLNPRFTDSYLANSLTFYIPSSHCHQWPVSRSFRSRHGPLLGNRFHVVLPFCCSCIWCFVSQLSSVLHRMQNSPQPFHGTQVTPVMLPTKSRPLGLASARRTELLFDPTYCTSIGWHLGTSGGGLVIASRLVAFYLVGSYAFILQQYHTNSHGPSVATLISTRLLV